LWELLRQKHVGYFRPIETKVHFHETQGKASNAHKQNIFMLTRVYSLKSSQTAAET